MYQKFNIGDLVYLKSGSVRQVISAVDPITQQVTTVWVHFETQTPHTMTAHWDAFDLVGKPVQQVRTPPDRAEHYEREFNS